MLDLGQLHNALLARGVVARAQAILDYACAEDADDEMVAGLHEAMADGWDREAALCEDVAARLVPFLDRETS